MANGEPNNAIGMVGLAAVNLQGFVDAIERGVVYGWAWNPRQPEDSIDVEILLGNRRLAVVTADEFREDLVELEIGDGRHAFRYSLPEELVGEVDAAEIEVRFAGGEVPLPRMRERPQRRVRPDGERRSEDEMILALRERIAMQEKVIGEMSNLLRALVERLRETPARGGGDRDPAVEGELLAAIEKQADSLRGLETYVATFGEGLRGIVEAQDAKGRGETQHAPSSRWMDTFFVVLLVGLVVGFVLAFGDFF